MRTLHKQAGIALVTAIFLLVVLAGLAVAVISLSTSQQDTAIKDEMGTRAYLAARAGMEWALFAARAGDPDPNVDHFAALNCPVSFPMPAGTTLSAFSVEITCSAVAPGFDTVTTTGPTAGHFLITVTACNATPCGAANPGPDYVQRRITAQL